MKKLQKYNLINSNDIYHLKIYLKVNWSILIKYFLMYFILKNIVNIYLNILYFYQYFCRVIVNFRRGRLILMNRGAIAWVWQWRFYSESQPRCQAAGIHKSLQKRRLPTRDASRILPVSRRNGKSAFTFRIEYRSNIFRQKDDGIEKRTASNCNTNSKYSYFENNSRKIYNLSELINGEFSDI